MANSITQSKYKVKAGGTFVDPSQVWDKSGGVFQPIFSSGGEVLLIDFGPTTIAVDQEENSPYHAETSGTETSWVKMQTSDITSGVIYGDGSAATGVELIIGAGESYVVNFSSKPSSTNELGLVLNTGIYTTGAPARDGIFNGPQGSMSPLCLKVGGLPSGNYDVYISGLNTNVSADLGGPSYYAVFADGSLASVDTEPLAWTEVDNSVTSVWSAGVNYGKFSISITSGQFIYAAVKNETPDQLRGFFNLVAIHKTA